MKLNLNTNNLNNISNSSPVSNRAVSHNQINYRGLNADKFELSSHSSKGGVKNFLGKIKKFFSKTNPAPVQPSLNNNQISFTGKKKGYHADIISPEDIDAAKKFQKKYFEKFAPDIKESQLALDIVDQDIADEIKKSHDIFTVEEICSMQDAKESADNFSIKDIVKKRGSYAKLAQKDITGESDALLGRELGEYVNRYVEFTSQDKNRLALSTARINELINRYGTTPEQKTLYRGVLDDFEITRLFSLLEAKQNNPNETILYHPSKLTSVTKSQEVTAKTYGQKCMLEIEVPADASKDSIKLLDVNDIFKKLNLKYNKFDFQEELLVGSKNSFIIKGLKFVNNIPTFIVQLAKTGA